MRPVFVNSAIVRAPERFMLNGGAWRMIDVKVRYGFLDHPTLGPVLIDTGYGPRVTIGKERSYALKAYAATLRPQLITDNCALPFLRSKGIQPEDIRTIIVTHFHADHVSALLDFPNARFLLSRNVWESFVGSAPLSNLCHGIFAELIPVDFADRMTIFETLPVVLLGDPFGQGHDVLGDGSVLSVDLPGHAAGHCGLFFTHGPRHLLYATDAQWLPEAITENRSPGVPATRIYDDAYEAASSAAKVRAFAAKGGDFLLCHQPQTHEYDCEFGIGQ
jgi:glyoxylase-like metal-dependent hydrolase (beta-lactamase superfamily II)